MYIAEAVLTFCRLTILMFACRLVSYKLDTKVSQLVSSSNLTYFGDNIEGSGAGNEAYYCERARLKSCDQFL